MYKQTTITPEGKTTTRTINSEVMISLLTQLHLLRQSGEDIEVVTNASEENGWKYNRITVIRTNRRRGCTTTIFEEVK